MVSWQHFDAATVRARSVGCIGVDYDQQLENEVGELFEMSNELLGMRKKSRLNLTGKDL